MATIPLYRELVTYGDITMWVLILLGSVVGLVGFMMIADTIVWKDYPVSDEYWVAGLVLIGFIVSLMAMILI